MKLLLHLLFLVMMGSAYAQSNLPACEGSEISRWTNCFGSGTWSNGDKYIGEWKDGKRHGQGTYTLAKGDKYIGEYKDGKLHGQGTFALANGDKYVGEFKDGNTHGQVTFTYANGNKFIGEYKDGKRHGQGTLTFANGNKFIGEYKDGKVHGQMTATFANGNKYVGEQKEGKFHGQGTYTFANGDKYVGEYAENKYHGKGVFTFANGNKYVGEYKDGKYSGQGIFYASNGSILQQGIWDENKLIRSTSSNKLDSQKQSNEATETLMNKAQAQQTEQRVALVIGNASYKDSPLRNPVNDAKDIAETLKGLGFKVILRINSDRRQMIEAVREFGSSIKRGGVGLFYYAGHGVQSRGKNFLMPVGARIEGEGDLEFEAMDANMVLAQMDEAANRVNIVVLDACRDNPYTRSFRSANKGLAQMDSVKGSFIAYSTAPGSVAADGIGRNGTYTKHLLTSLRQSDTKIEEVFKRVRLEVARETGNKQIPWDSSSLLVDFYFSAPGTKVATQSNPVVRPQLTPPQLEEKPINLAGVWRGQFRGTEVVFSIVQDGASVSLTRISPPAIGQRYAGTINGNTSDVIVYMNDVAIATSRISVLEDSSLRMTVMDCFNVPGYTCAPKGSVLDLMR